jgi:acyl-CoA synthetase (AMP-forming)/AMP-acid ligase II
MGEEVGAFIRLKDTSKPLTRDDIKNFCNEKLSHFKIPRYVVIVEELPRTTSGKVQKFSFFERFAHEIKRVQSTMQSTSHHIN